MNISKHSQIQDISPESIIQTVFKITTRQLEIFQLIRKNGIDGICITRMTQDFQAERSVIQKSLQILLKKQLIRRELVSLNNFNFRCKNDSKKEYQHETNTGALYLYFPESNETIRYHIIERLMSWKGIIDQYF